MARALGSGLEADEVMVFGLGGHKCGSSWLSEYFRKHPQCFVSSQKELDIFGSRDIRHHNWRIRHRSDKITNAVKDFRKLLNEDHNIDPENIEKFHRFNARIFDLAQNISVLTGYGDLADIFRRRDESEKFVFDISPIYSTLDTESYEEMVNAHQNVKFLFSMRDPAERFFSAYKYGRSLDNLRVPRRNSWKIGQLTPLLNDWFYIGCTDYARSLDALEKVASKDQIHTCFYEELFQDASIEKICNFIGIDFKPGDYGHMVHTTINEDEIVKMPQEVREFLVKELAPIYKSLDQRFGDEAPNSWNWPEDIKKARDARQNNKEA